MRIIFFLIIFLPSICFANPWIVSAPSPDGATHWQGEMNGVVSAILEGNQVKYDIGDINPGEYVFKAKFLKEWSPVGSGIYTSSEWSTPFLFIKPDAPAIPGNIRISID